MTVNGQHFKKFSTQRQKSYDYIFPTGKTTDFVIFQHIKKPGYNTLPTNWNKAIANYIYHFNTQNELGSTEWINVP